MTHLSAAHRLLPTGSDAWFLGSVLPDCVDGDRALKDRLHFRDLPGEKRFPALLAFAEKKLSPANDFDLGVFFHYYLDLLWDRGPQRWHRQVYRGDRWFKDYRCELSKMGLHLAHTDAWAYELWEKLGKAPLPDREADLEYPPERMRSFLDFNVQYHRGPDEGASVFFTPDWVDAFLNAACGAFCRLAEGLPDWLCALRDRGIDPAAFPGNEWDVPYRPADARHTEKILVLMGGISTERAISLKSGEAVTSALREAGYDAHSLDLTPETLPELLKEKPDLVFLALHGKGGEDGSIQGLLEWLRLPYTGPGVASSAQCMDKILTKRLLVAAGVATAPFAELDPAAAPEEAARAALPLGLPLVLKASRQGSSIGTVIVRKESDFADAFREVAAYGDGILAEAFLAGTELTVPVLGDGSPEALPVIEITSSGAFYDFESKYTPGGSHHIIPARIPEETRAKAESLALAAYRAAGCRGFARVDLMLDGEGKPFVLEINTIPGMTAQSLLPDAGRAVGLSFPALAEKIVMSALRERQKPV